jgi:class 3 adenylate cyclase
VTESLAAASAAVGDQPADVLTFLFADIRGYTRYTEQRGDEAAARLAAKFAATTREGVDARGGEVIELRGDEALAVFRSARQALRAATDLQAVFSRASVEDAAMPLPVGMGLDVGEAIPVEGGYRGGALNLAARLCALAGSGEVLASEGVIHLARKMDDLTYAERGFTQLKGFDDPVRVIQVTASAVGSSLLAGQGPAGPVLGEEGEEETRGVAGEEGALARPQDLPIGGFLGALPDGPLVARDEELQAILKIVDAVVEGRGQLLLLAGEPGIGKTRLAQEATLDVRNRRFLVTTGRCYEPQQTIQFYPFLDALATVYANCPAAIRAELPRHWPTLGRLLPDANIPGSEAGTGSQEEQQRLFRSVTGFLQSVAAAVPTALLLDDVHWMDDASLELLQHIVRHTRSDRILILGTYRDIDVTRRHPLDAALRDLMREDLVERIIVRRLDQQGTAALMAAAFGEQDISTGFANLVHRRTEGNPFFVQHVLRVLVERGDVFRRDGSWTRKDLDEIEVPESVRSVIAQRLAHLDEATQEVLREASVLGQTFTFDDLMQLGNRAEQEIEAALEAVAARGLVRETGRDVYAFDHALTQQSLYAELTGRRRRRLHLAAGEALERLPQRVRERRAGELAWHFEEGDDVDRALPYAILAGDEARTAFAHEEAERQYTVALDLARQMGDVARENEILERRGRLSLDSFKGKAAVVDYEQLLARARLAGDRAQEIQILLGLARAVYIIALDETNADAASRCRDLYEAAYELARRIDDKRSMVRALLGARWLQDFWPEYREQSMKNRREALAISEELGDDELIIESKLTLWRSLERKQGERLSEELVSQLKERNALHQLNELYFGLMWAHRDWGNLERAVEICDAGIQLADELGVPPVQYPTLKALSLLRLGRYGEAWDALQREVADSEHPFGRAMQGIGEGVYLLDLLAYDKAIAVLEDVIERAKQVQRAWMRRWAWNLLVQALGRAGRLDAVELQAAIDDLAAIGVVLYPEVLAEALLSMGRAPEALEHIDAAAAAERAAAFSWDLADALALQSRILAELGRREDALAEADEALRLAEEMRGSPLVWRVQAIRAGLLASLGDETAAREASRSAADVVRELAGTIPDAELKQTFLDGAKEAGAG